MNFRNQINNNTSKITYDSTKNLTIHGTWQGTRNEGTHWCFMSVPMMEIVDQVAPGCTIELPKGNAKWNIKMMGFVDDKRHYINTLTHQLITTFIKAMEQSISTLYELLLFVGGELELSKCEWYIVDWGFDRNGKPQIKKTNRISGSTHHL